MNNDFILSHKVGWAVQRDSPGFAQPFLADFIFLFSTSTELLNFSLKHTKRGIKNNKIK